MNGPAESLDEIQSISEVEPDEWDAVAGDHAYLRHGWLQAVERTTRDATATLGWILRDGEGIRAALVGRLQGRAGAANDLDTVLFGRLSGPARRLRLGVTPALICGVRTGTGPPVLVRAGLSDDDRQAAVASLVQTLEQRADEERWTLCLRNVLAEESGLNAALDPGRYLASPEMPTTVLDVRWKSFDEYLAQLRSTHPRTARNIRHSSNQARREGLEIEEIEDPHPQAGHLHGLLDAHYRRLNGQPFPYGVDFLAAVKDGLGPDARIYAARQAGEIVGVQLVLRGGRRMWASMIGIDPGKTRRSGAYFHLGYHHLIERAAQEGVETIILGKLTYEPKILRGCRLLGMRLMLRPRSRLQRAILAPLASYRDRWFGGAMEPYREVLIEAHQDRG